MKFLVFLFFSTIYTLSVVGQYSDSLHIKKSFFGLKYYSNDQKISINEFENKLFKNRKSKSHLLASQDYKKKERISNYLVYGSAIAFGVSALQGLKPKYLYPLGGIVLGCSISSSIFHKKKQKFLIKSVNAYNMLEQSK
ncbi:MAG: hypothetical protein WAT37_15070 [Saprospiraceae bacterium]|nr:hypothetical protein [Saprospiraceae bacterium]